MANKKNWYDTIGDRVADAEFKVNVPSLNRSNFIGSLFREPFDLHLTPIDDFMEELEGLGFRDKGDYYEMVTNLGGTKGDAGSPENAVQVKLTGKNNRTVEITYEHSTSDDKDCFYSHSQKTCVTLPTDADDKTIEAHFNDDDNVVISVKKKTVHEEPKVRNIPIGR